MHSYAQTNPQLFNQLRREGYPKRDLNLIRDAYENAMVLFSGRFEPSGKSFISHVVGTASILASLRLPGPIVAAGLLHNVYESGDFGDGRGGMSRSKRRRIRKTLGSEVETYVAKFPALYWEAQTTQIARYDPDKLDPIDRGVLLILFAEHLEHLLDSNILYYNERAGRFFVEHGKRAAEIAQALGVPRLASELRTAILETESNRTLAWPAEHRFRDDAFVVVPRSCRKRFTATLRGRTYWFRRKFLLLGRQTSQSIKRARRWLIGHRSPAAGLVAKSPMFFDLFPKNAIPERIATGFRFTEGPVWIHEKERLLFSDIPANCIYELAADGCITKFRKLSGNSNGLTLDRQGRLIACEHANRRVTRTEADGSVTVLAESFRGKKLNSPNDVVVKSDGAIYFTDPAYGIRAAEQEQQIEGVYRLSPDARELSLVADDFDRPNGLAFSPDENHLYIDDSERRQIRVFKVEADGSLSGGSVFHDMNIATPGAPDGMKVDVEGRLYCTGAGGIWVFSSQGNHLGTVVTPEKPSNCSWGDDDWCGLYITAGASVYKIRVNIPGVRTPSVDWIRTQSPVLDGSIRKRF